MCMLWIVYTCGPNKCACYEYYIHVDQMNVHVMNSIYMWTKWMCMSLIVYTGGPNECACHK